MHLLELLKAEATKRGLLEPGAEMDVATVFDLVRDMPYSRAVSREPEVTIREWRGTCSGKHYLLKALFAELGLRSRVMACSTELTIDPDRVPAELHPILKEADGRIIDIHTYLAVDLHEGEMIVDATWPLEMKSLGFNVNETFTIGENQRLSCNPIKSWVVPEARDPQEFKEALLRKLFTAEELRLRDHVLVRDRYLTRDRYRNFALVLVQLINLPGLAQALQTMMGQPDTKADWDRTEQLLHGLFQYQAANNLLSDCLEVAYLSDRAAIEDSLWRLPGDSGRGDP